MSFRGNFVFSLIALDFLLLGIFWSVGLGMADSKLCNYPLLIF